MVLKVEILKIEKAGMMFLLISIFLKLNLYSPVLFAGTGIGTYFF